MRFSPAVLAVLLLGCSSGSGTRNDAAANDAAANDGPTNDGPTNDLTTTTDGGVDTSSPGVLDCAWLEGPNNCWQTTLAMAASCLPPTSSWGTLSADGRTCTYASGEVATFAQALVLPTPIVMYWNFTITGAAGQPCLHYQDDASGLQLTVGGQTFTEKFLGGTGLLFTCPDGTKVEDDAAVDLLSCPRASATSLPGVLWSSTDTKLEFGLTGTTTQPVVVLNCAKP